MRDGVGGFLATLPDLIAAFATLWFVVFVAAFLALLAGMAAVRAACWVVGGCS